MVAAVHNELQRGILWNIAIELSQHKYLINSLNIKYGWEKDDSFDDTQQELILIAYHILSEYETKNNLCLLNIENNKKLKQYFINNIIGRYRVYVWNHRSDNAIRKSDIYNNIETGSIEDTNIYCSSLETDKQFYYNNSKTDIDNQEINSYLERREVICKNLTSILHVNVEEILNMYLYGTDKNGFMTHAEISKTINKCRSAVTRRINRATKFLSTFINKHKLTYEQLAYPSNQDMLNILNIIKKYNMAKTSKQVRNNSTLIEFFKHNLCSIYTPEQKDSINNKDKKVYMPQTLNYTIYQHNIEEYLEAI